MKRETQTPSRFGRFRILKKLRQAPTGPIWLAEDEFLRRRLALAILDDARSPSEETLRRFVRDAHAASALSHPGLVKILDAGEESGRTFIAFEAVEAESIRDEISGGPFDLHRAVSIATQVAEALAHAHDQGLFHGDLTSRSVMIEAGDRARVVDVGLVPGTANATSDLLGMGAVLYEMLTGRPVAGTPDPPRRLRPEVPEDLERVALRLLGASTDRPYESARELARDLQQLRRQYLPSQREHSGPPATLGRAWGKRWVRIAIPAVVVAAVATILWERMDPGAPRYGSIAVLPLVVEGDGSGDAELWAAGISEAIVTKLTNVPDLQVTPWVTSQGYSLAFVSLPQVFGELGVETLLSGRIELQGGAISGSVRLMASGIDDEVWTTEFREPLAGILRVQDEIARSVAEKLRGRLTGEQAAVLERELATTMEAYQYYLRGSAKLREQTFDANEEARTLFGKSLDLDPKFAPAHVGIGTVYVERAWFQWDVKESNNAIAEGSFRKALALDPGNIRALRGLVRIENMRGRFLELLAISREVNGLPETAETLSLRAEALLLGGLADAAAPVLERIVELDPANAGAFFFLPIAYCWSGRFEDAIRAGDEFFRRFGEDHEIHLWLGTAHENLGRPETALLHYEASNDLSPGPSRGLWEHEARVLRRLGKTGRAETLLWEGVADIRRRMLAVDLSDVEGQAWLALAYGQLGKRDEVSRVATHVTGQPITDLQEFVNLATALVYVGDYDGARAMLERCLEAGWANVQALNMVTGTFGNREVFEQPGHEDLKERWEATLHRLRQEYAQEIVASDTP